MWKKGTMSLVLIVNQCIVPHPSTHRQQTPHAGNLLPNDWHFKQSNIRCQSSEGVAKIPSAVQEGSLRPQLASSWYFDLYLRVPTADDQAVLESDATTHRDNPIIARPNLSLSTTVFQINKYDHYKLTTFETCL